VDSVALRAEGLGKQYKIGARRERYKTARESLTKAVTSPVSRFSRRESATTQPTDSWFWALRDVSFEIHAGEAVGVIGRNGAGKSTLLKLLSRITQPTAGYAEIRGRVGSLLEVGSGFHLELTGRENVYLNGAILGMRKREIDRKFDQIVAFSELQRFIDTPVKRYSTGMHMRLAFAVAAHLETEVLLVDEVLAVGDASFQRKCLGKINDVASEGRTVLFVSHNMAAINQLCSRALVLDGGMIQFDGGSRRAIEDYLLLAEATTPTTVVPTDAIAQRAGTGEGRIISVAFENLSSQAAAPLGIAESIRIDMVAKLEKEVTRAVVGIEIRNSDGYPLINLRSDSQGLVFGPFPAHCVVRFRVDVPGLPLYPNRYLVSPWFADSGGERIDHLESGITLSLVSKGNLDSESLIQPRRGVMLLDCQWEAEVQAGEPATDESSSLR
jgi:lipopolysaccharide transport system ATP-binding protein